MFYYIRKDLQKYNNKKIMLIKNDKYTTYNFFKV